MKEFPFLQMELEHPLTVQTRGVMIGPSGTQNCEANRPGIGILVSDLTSCYINNVYIQKFVVHQKTVPMIRRNIKDVK